MSAGECFRADVPKYPQTNATRVVFFCSVFPRRVCFSAEAGAALGTLAATGVVCGMCTPSVPPTTATSGVLVGAARPSIVLRIGHHVLRDPPATTGPGHSTNTTTAGAQVSLLAVSKSTAHATAPIATPAGLVAANGAGRYRVRTSPSVDGPGLCNSLVP